MEGISGGGTEYHKIVAKEEALITDSALEAIRKRGLKNLIEILRNRPELVQFVTRKTAIQAYQAIYNLELTLQKYPDLLKQLKHFSDEYPHDVAMAVLPNENLVFMQTPNGVEGFAPVLTCTHLAMAGIKEKFVTSDNSPIIPDEAITLDSKGHPIVSYLSGQMNPVDYVALGVRGLFVNETFRFRIIEGRVIK